MDTQPSNRRRAVLLFVIPAVAIVALDQWSKKAVFDLLNVVETVRVVDGTPRPLVVHQERYVVIEDFFWLEANYNYGAFNGWFAESTKGLAMLSALAALVITGIFIAHVARHRRAELSLVLALSLLLGGTVGNLYDRAVLHAVRDWIRWFVVINGRERVWPNFNIADSAICTAVGILLLMEFLRWRRDVKTAKELAAKETTARPG